MRAEPELVVWGHITHGGGFLGNGQTPLGPKPQGCNDRVLVTGNVPLGGLDVDLPFPMMRPVGWADDLDLPVIRTATREICADNDA